MLRAASKIVFACFKVLERAADRFTGIAGPFFVGLAWILISTGVIYFFHIIAPILRLPLLSIPLAAWSALNLLGHYYWTCTVSPGTPEDTQFASEGRGWQWWTKRGPQPLKSPLEDTFTSDDTWVLAGERNHAIKCRKCVKPKPERAHHCRICNTCILKYDHHCPWINQCVGLRNERHFILFMVYLVISCAFFVSLGYELAWLALDFSPNKWPYILPPIPFVLIFVLALALGLAVGIMLLWHLYLISGGETTVESYDFARYREVATHRGTVFINSYDLGRRKNLELFFNVGSNGYPLYTLLFPLRCMPYSDGIAWARRPGYTRHAGIGEADELTDEEEL